MRHRNSGRKLSRTSSHRKLMFSNICNALIEHELIKTTLAKAKELRGYIEPLITVSKSDSVAARRYVFDRLRSKSAVGKLFTTLGPRYQTRPGGYVRVLKCGFRAGDSAPMAIVELVDRNLDLNESKDDVGSKKPKASKAKNKENTKEVTKKDDKTKEKTSKVKASEKTVPATEKKMSKKASEKSTTSNQKPEKE